MLDAKSAPTKSKTAPRATQKFIGAYVAEETKNKLQAIAAAHDRPLAWVIKKILVEGVKHQPAAIK